MSIQAVAWVLEHSEATLADRLVLIAIANHADARGANAWPSTGQIAREAGVDRRTVLRAIVNLEELGELVVERHSGRSSTYRLTGDKLSQVRGGRMSQVRGDKLSPGDDNLSQVRGVTSCHPGVTSDPKTCDILSPEPSLTVLEPSPARARARPRTRGAPTAAPKNGDGSKSKDPLVIRAARVVPGTSYDRAHRLVDELEGEGIGRLVIDEAIGFALGRDDVKSLGFLQQIARDWMGQRDGTWNPPAANGQIRSMKEALNDLGLPNR